MARTTLGDSNCPCQEDYSEGPHWCYVVISHDPVLNILEAPYYENLFEVVPIDGEYFIENIIVTHFEQTTSNLPNWKLQYPNCPYAALTKYSGSDMIIQLEDTTITKPMFGKTDHDLKKALLTTTLFKVFPYVENMFENFSLNQDDPLGITRYGYYITMYHNAKPHS